MRPPVPNYHNLLLNTVWLIEPAEQDQKVVPAEAAVAVIMKKNQLPAGKNQPPAGKTQKVDPRDGWECPTCTLQNPPNRPGCEACTTERPKDYQIPAPGPLDTIPRGGVNAPVTAPITAPVITPVKASDNALKLKQIVKPTAEETAKEGLGVPGGSGVPGTSKETKDAPVPGKTGTETKEKVWNLILFYSILVWYLILFNSLIILYPRPWNSTTDCVLKYSG